MALEGRTQKIINEMRGEGRVVTLSRDASHRLDHHFAAGFAPIKEEFERKKRGSEAYAADLESGRLTLYKQRNLYQKVIEYISDIFK